MKHYSTKGLLFFCLFFIEQFILFTSIQARDISEQHKKLEFLLGEWESISTDHSTSKKSIGHSSIQWILQKKWLQWKFTAQTENGPLDVLTLINYNTEKAQYAFYSYNPFDDEPLPHFGNWIDENTLRLKIKSEEEEMWIDFRIKDKDNFEQIHTEIRSFGKKIKKGTTHYTKIHSTDDKE